MPDSPEEYMIRLIELRKKSGMSQAEVAKAIKITPRMYFRYEHGDTALPVRHLIALCELFNASSDDILGLHDLPPVDIPCPEKTDKPPKKRKLPCHVKCRSESPPPKEYMVRLRDLRVDSGMTQADVAEAIGVSQHMYSRYERGIAELPIRYLIGLCDLLNVSSDVLFGYSDDSDDFTD